MEITSNCGDHVVSFSPGPYCDGDMANAAGMNFAKQLVSNLPAIRLYAAKQLLNTYNNSWVDAEHGPIDENQFVANLCQPQIVVLDEIDAASIYFNDSDMFGGHLIDVMIREGKPIHAAIAG